MTNRHQRVFQRQQNRLFGESEYHADFYDWSDGSYDPDTGEMTGQSRRSFATDVQVEIVPPGIDSTVDVDGTSFSWSTSIRFPLTTEDYGGWGQNWGQNWGSQRLSEVLVPLGEDADRPTEVEIHDETDDSTDRYELHGYSVENGSGMVMCRLVEQ